MESSALQRDNVPHTRQSFAQLAGYQYLCLFLWFFTIYSEIPLLLPGQKSMPAFLLVVFFPLLLPYIKHTFKVKHLMLPFGITAVAMASIVAKMDAGLLASSLFKIAQFFYSLFFCVITFLFLTQVNPVVLRRFLFVFSITIVAGCLLERIGVLSDITLAFRSVYAGTNYGGEISVEREIFISGFVRPYFFTSEPSLVGLGFFSVSTAWACLNRNMLLDGFMFLAGFIMLGLLGSPSVILSPLLILVIAGVKYRIPWVKTLLITGGLVTVLVVGYQTGVLKPLLESLVFRFSAELLQEGTSIYVRIYVPYVMTFPKMLETYPLWGVGYGNHGLINVLFGYSYTMEEDETLFLRGANAFVNFFTYLGMLGSILVFWLLYKFHRQNAVRSFLLTFLFLFFAGQITGTFATPRFWSFIALFMGTVYWAFRHPETSNGQPSQ